VRKPGWRAGLAAATGALLAGLAGCAPASTAARPLRIGAIFPLSGSAASLATEEYAGAQIAVQLVNQDGGVDGRQLLLDLRDVPTADGAAAAAASLRADGVPAVIGAYSSELSIPAAAAVARAGMVYWETGAVADQLTGQGLPLVFRVGADGADLGGNSAAFVLQQLAPRWHVKATQLRVYLVTADDDYARSVAAGVRSGLAGSGAVVVGESLYNPYAPLWAPVLSGIQRARPDILMLSAHIPDGVAFREAFVAAGLHVDAFIGTTMAQCVPDFGSELGAEAYGVFASDRPDDDFNPGVLDPAARALFNRFSTAWQEQMGSQPDEEAIAGFSAAWALLHDVLPRAAALTPPSIAAAARVLRLPSGSLPNGAGLDFSAGRGRLGQNLLAAAVIEEWESGGERTVWPPAYATGPVALAPV
jgi:branched-chain amino acid transport system substrate-binding protein